MALRRWIDAYQERQRAWHEWDYYDGEWRKMPQLSDHQKRMTLSVFPIPSQIGKTVVNARMAHEAKEQALKLMRKTAPPSEEI